MFSDVQMTNLGIRERQADNTKSTRGAPLTPQYTQMPPRRPVADSLTEHETTLLETAVRFDAALRHWEMHRGSEPVVEWYIKCIDDELTLQKDINRIFDSYPPGDIGPRIHPLLEYVANWWDDGEKKGMIFNLDDMNLADVQDMCDKEAKSDPFSCSLLYTRSLSLFLEEQDEDAYWWLPPSFITGDTIAGSSGPSETPREPASGSMLRRSGRLSAGKSIDRSVGAANPNEPITPPPKDAYYASDDVEMEGEDRTETPVTSRQGSVLRCNHPRHTIAIPIDPDACGPCGHGRRDCYPQPGSVRALACHECTQRKLKCTPLAAWAKAIQKANSQKAKDAAKNRKKPGMEDVYQEFQLFKVEQRAHNTLVRDLAFNADAMLRALCKQAAVNLSTLRLRTPAVPLFTEPRPGTPTESSIPSPASTTTSSLHISRLHIKNQPDTSEAEASGPTLRARTGRGGTSKPPSRAPSASGSRQSSRTSPRVKGRNCEDAELETPECVNLSIVPIGYLLAASYSTNDGRIITGYVPDIEFPFWALMPYVHGTGKHSEYRKVPHHGALLSGLYQEYIGSPGRNISAWRSIFKTPPTHMESHTYDTENASTLHDHNTSVTDVRHPSISFSDPEDNISSGRESFDEDDMYGSDTGDDFICDSMESDGGSQEPARGIAHGLCIHLENIYTLTRALCEAREIEGVSALPLGPTLIDDLTLRTSSELIGSNIVDIEEEAENDEFGVAY
ncbi:hypothetical protein EDB84DRAFT_1440619 [Lactarius hengduanensis]|nr:hypothetical protein EDB84DRAFT_1440619 [Lactarius hengduanensis]